jgi:hypothetical protein
MVLVRGQHLVLRLQREGGGLRVQGLPVRGLEGPDLAAVQLGLVEKN